MGRIIRLLGAGSGNWARLPQTVMVASLVLRRAGVAPLYVRSLNKNCSVCVAASDDGNWIGFVIARFSVKSDDLIDESSTDILCQAKASNPVDCARALGEVMKTGIEMADKTPEGKSALAKLQSDQTL